MTRELLIVGACLAGGVAGMFCVALFSAGLMIAGAWLWSAIWQAVL